MKRYTLGFLVDGGGSVALVRKKKGPGGQKGKLNGFGGHIESGETSLECMRREFLEESGWPDSPRWHKFGALGDEWTWTCDCYWASCQDFETFCGSENVEVYPIDKVPGRTVTSVRALLHRVEILAHMEESDGNASMD